MRNIASKPTKYPENRCASPPLFLFFTVKNIPRNNIDQAKNVINDEDTDE